MNVTGESEMTTPTNRTTVERRSDRELVVTRSFDAPARIVFNDHRRFGLMTLVPSAQLDDDKLFAGLGVEPLSAAFNAARLEKMSSHFLTRPNFGKRAILWLIKIDPESLTIRCDEFG